MQKGLYQQANNDLSFIVVASTIIAASAYCYYSDLPMSHPLHFKTYISCQSLRRGMLDSCIVGIFFNAVDACRKLSCEIDLPDLSLFCQIRLYRCEGGPRYLPSWMPSKPISAISSGTRTWKVASTRRVPIATELVMQK